MRTGTLTTIGVLDRDHTMYRVPCRVQVGDLAGWYDMLEPCERFLRNANWTAQIDDLTRAAW